MDYRDVAGHYRSVLQDVDRRRMTAMIEANDGTEHQVSLKFDVCGTCQGRGAHVNPSIDSHGLTGEDFEDRDFEEGYMRGAYDVSCAECKGERLVLVVDEDHTPAEIVTLWQELEADEWANAREITREREMGY